MGLWPAFILDIANNHGGDVERGVEIVDAMAAVLHKHHAVNTAFKLQYRDLEHYAHGDEAYREKFQKSWLSWSDYDRLAQHIRAQGFLTCCTAFDAGAAGWMGLSSYDYAKVASCSARDWYTIEAIAELALPTIFSVGGLGWNDIDNIVSYATHRGLEFALLHCVSIYPAELDQLNLSKIAAMRRRYPGIEIGWSTHENPDELGPIQMAYAYGARIFERHVDHRLERNAYSMNAEQLDYWIDAWQCAQDMGEYQGDTGGLERAAMAKVERRGCNDPHPSAKPHPLKRHVHRAKGLLNEAGIPISPDFTVEFSHHYGVGNFERFGSVLITLVNRDYCKKLIVTQKGQAHPCHYHKLKEETFQVLYGKLWIEIDGRSRELVPGDLVTVLPGQWHSFVGLEDTVFEEISTRALSGDSVYRDPLIMANSDRKTAVTNWGRFELG